MAETERRGQAAFRAGWLMAQLYGPALNSGGTAAHHLPSISGLPVSDRVELAVRELEDALATAATGIPYEQDLDAVKAVPRSGKWHEPFKDAVEGLHRLLIIEFTARDPRFGRAYGLGRSLSDTAWLPSGLTVFKQQLSRFRVAELDSWLASLEEILGHDAVTAVRGSLRAWSAWAADPFIGRRGLDWARDCRSVELALRHQGAIWHDLLCAEREPASLVTAEAYVEAADMALRRGGFLARQVLIRFWYAVASLLAIATGLIYLSVVYAAGMSKFWGVFATAAGGSGALVTGVRLTLSKVGRRTGAPLGRAERDDALRAGATRLPAGATAGRGRRRHRSEASKRPDTTAAQPPPDQTQTSS